jgi:hypothetical protein
MLGKTKMAFLWAEKELAVDSYYVGEDHPGYTARLDILHRLREGADGLKPVHASVVEWFTIRSSSDDPCATM